MNEASRTDKLNEIVERELAMFLATPNEGGPASCQQRPETFRLMRKMAHSAHDEVFLDSYLQDLRAADAEGRNFMIEKYARMQGLIPPINTNPLVDKIADAETAWRAEAAIQKPGMVKTDDGGYFHRYLRAELETLSSRSLELYFQEVSEARTQGRNLFLERHEWLAREMGRAPGAASGENTSKSE